MLGKDLTEEELRRIRVHQTEGAGPLIQAALASRQTELLEELRRLDPRNAVGIAGVQAELAIVEQLLSWGDGTAEPLAPIGPPRDEYEHEETWADRVRGELAQRSKE